METWLRCKVGSSAVLLALRLEALVNEPFDSPPPSQLLVQQDLPRVRGGVQRLAERLRAPREVVVENYQLFHVRERH